ncbi:hypothetical protein CFP65_2915 [Kitasatospora sp. MMS16-BH015]|uniref:hypothetical protein n=1 Tax=Kitasatospora sp. MMS16-BH015 TaxID=2018025 RepID=UPI000CA30770|nr:hypothetical protein [Kitasatospora sp. MMS16-BH015]AUG77726.1 hypothetical protein CFP65_2915 [Kitasatospora sp. MMS16-BH015]
MSTRPGVVVGGLTALALAVVTLLAVQANGTERTATAKPAATPSSAAPSPTASPTATLAALPPASGSGRRVVYSTAAHQVWLVDPKKTPQIQATFRVTPGTVDPTPGTFTVYSRSATGTGTDDRPIEHVVRFAQQAGTVFGFSAATSDTAPTTPPDPTKKTGGIRPTRADGQLLWDFATNGTKVTVVG